MLVENVEFIAPLWMKDIKNLRCGFTLPVLGNFALTRKSIYSGRSTKENINLLIKKLNIPFDNIFIPKQIHSDKVIIVDETYLKKRRTNIKGDACITKLKNFLLITTWADCVPVLLYDKIEQIAATVHSGWKGTQFNIVGKVIDEFIKMGSKVDNIYVAIGPAIKDCCYKVGEEFLLYFKNTPLMKFFKRKDNLLFFDLSNAVYFQIKEKGIPLKNIDFINKCTCCSKNPVFFSCRKDGKENFESQAAFIVIFDN